jgi:hypothetical protein
MGVLISYEVLLETTQTNSNWEALTRREIELELWELCSIEVYCEILQRGETILKKISDKIGSVVVEGMD